MAAPWEYIFNANDQTGPGSFPAMEARRRIALQLLTNSRKGYPKNVGEGLTAIGDAIGDRSILEKLATQEAGYQKLANATAAGAVPGEARLPGQQSEDTTQPAPVRTAYAPTSPPVDTVDAEGTVNPNVKNSLDALSDYRPAPTYLQSSLNQLIQDPDRRGYLGQLASREAQSPTEVSSTGAAGPFQFTQGTGRQYGLMGAGGDQRTNIDASILAANKLTDDNVATLTAKLGRPPTPSEMALAHQQGAVTASRMLTGTGNAPANNLAVNNVNPGAAPQDAANKIMDYYGMPGSRNRIAATLASRQTAPVVPQPNPTLAGGNPLSASALPLGGDNSQANAFAGLPPEITTGASAVRAAPPAPSGMQAIPTQLAQAAPPAVTPGVWAASPAREPLPALGPMTDDEKRGYNLKARGAAMGDKGLMDQGQSLIEYGYNQRAKELEIRTKDFQDRMLMRRQRELAEEQRAYEAPERELRMKVAKQGLEQGAITPPSPGMVPTQMAGPGAPSGYDTRLGTDASPQRTGVPAAPRIPPGITPAQHAAQQAPILTQAVQAVDKAVPEFNRALDEIQKIRKHAGKDWGLGMTGPIAGSFPTEAKDFLSRVDQLKNQTFLQAYASLKGGGQISNIEGEKAQQAQARLDPKNAKGFDAALNDLEKQLRSDLEVAQRKVNRPVTAWPVRGAPGISPDLGERRGDWQYIGGAPDNKDSWRPAQ